MHDVLDPHDRDRRRALMARMVATSSAHSPSVSPPAISSSSRSRGASASARAISSRLRSSRVSVPAGDWRRPMRPVRSRMSPQACGDLAPRAAAAVDRADQQVLEHGEVLERLRDLVRAADAGAAARVRRQPRDVAAVEPDRRRRPARAAGDQVEQRRFAGAVRPDDAERLAGGEATPRRFERAERSVEPSSGAASRRQSTFEWNRFRHHAPRESQSAIISLERLRQACAQTPPPVPHGRQLGFACAERATIPAHAALGPGNRGDLLGDRLHWPPTGISGAVCCR